MKFEVYYQGGLLKYIDYPCFGAFSVDQFLMQSWKSLGKMEGIEILWLLQPGLITTHLDICNKIPFVEGCLKADEKGRGLWLNLDKPADQLIGAGMLVRVIYNCRYKVDDNLLRTLMKRFFSLDRYYHTAGFYCTTISSALPYVWTPSLMNKFIHHTADTYRWRQETFREQGGYQRDSTYSMRGIQENWGGSSPFKSLRGVFIDSPDSTPYHLYRASEMTGSGYTLSRRFFTGYKPDPSQSTDQAIEGALDHFLSSPDIGRTG